MMKFDVAVVVIVWLFFSNEAKPKSFLIETSDHEESGDKKLKKEEAVGDEEKDCSCGVRNVHKKSNIKGRRIYVGIVGRETQPHEFPWQVALTIKLSGIHNILNPSVKKEQEKTFCGGSIISSKTILTAQHCISPLKLLGLTDQMKVLVGEHNMEDDADGQQTFEIEKIIDFNSKNITDYILNDFALIILKKKITWSNTIRPICLPERDVFRKYDAFRKYDDVKAIVTGWGSTNGTAMYNLLQPPTLQMAELQTMKDKQCAISKTAKEKVMIMEMDLKNGSGPLPPKLLTKLITKQLCAFGAKEAACKGDSGGPLITEEKGGYYTQIGIVHGAWFYNDYGLCKSTIKTPSMYSRVTSELEWIKENMEGEQCPPPK